MKHWEVSKTYICTIMGRYAETLSVDITIRWHQTAMGATSWKNGKNPG